MKVYRRVVPSWGCGDDSPLYGWESVTLYGWEGANNIVVSTARDADLLSWYEYCEGLGEELAEAEAELAAAVRAVKAAEERVNTAAAAEEAIRRELTEAAKGYNTAFDTWEGWTAQEVNVPAGELPAGIVHAARESA